MISTHLPEDQAELFLRVGETIVVLEDFSDGWMAGEWSALPSQYLQLFRLTMTNLR